MRLSLTLDTISHTRDDENTRVRNGEKVHARSDQDQVVRLQFYSPLTMYVSLSLSHNTQHGDHNKLIQFKHHEGPRRSSLPTPGSPRIVYAWSQPVFVCWWRIVSLLHCLHSAALYNAAMWWFRSPASRSLVHAPRAIEVMDDVRWMMVKIKMIWFWTVAQPITLSFYLPPFDLTTLSGSK